MSYTPDPTWVDGNNGGTPITAAALNHIEAGLQAAAAVADAALPKPPTPVTNDGLFWNGTAWVSAKLADANVAAGAAIAYSKLNLAGLIVNTDIATGAGIATSKLAGYPNDPSKALFGDGTWASPAGATTYRKTTTATVNTTVTATDLLNGEITIAAGAMSTTKALRLSAWGDWLQNSGGTAAPPRFQLLLGSTPILDTGATAASINTGATRAGWSLSATILNSTASAQSSRLELRLAYGTVGGSAGNAFTTGVGYYQAVSNGSTQAMAEAVGTNTTTIDTTVSNLLVLKVINGSASATYETKLFGAIADVV